MKFSQNKGFFLKTLSCENKSLYKIFLYFKKFVIPLWAERLLTKNYAYGNRKRDII